MTRWEYRVQLTDEDHAFLVLKDAGEEGWELVAVVPSTRFTATGLTLFLKRPVGDRRPVAA
jgi:hypothetical protein